MLLRHLVTEPKTASLIKKKPGGFRAVNSNENKNIRRKLKTPNSSLFPVVSNRAETIKFRSLHASTRLSQRETLRTY
jgi:hypothetical protein